MGHLVATTEAGDARGAAVVASQLITALEKIGKVTGEIASIAGNINVNVAIVNHPEFIRAQATLLRALGPYPDARAAAAAALQALEAETPPDAPSRLIEAVPCPA
jgi:hypothetical protein